MASPVAKIIMKNTTKISLNERFTAYRQQSQNAASFFRQKLQSQRQASVENRRLAQQMANRPTVIAALRLKRRSLQQRLGQKRKPLQNRNMSIKSRLDFTARNFQGRLSGFRSTRGRNIQSNRRGRYQGYRGNFTRPGTSPMIKARLGTPLSDGNFSKFNSQKLRGSYGLRRNFGRGANRGQNINNKNAASNIRRAAGKNRRGQLSNRNWKPVPTKQELDNQLDEYMAETKSPLGSQFSHGF